MPSVNFEHFHLLWQNVEKKYVGEMQRTFDLNGLKDHLAEQNIFLNSGDLEKIQSKFLNFLESSMEPATVNLPENVYRCLFKYIEIRSITDLMGDFDVNEIARQAEAGTLGIKSIGFLGRREELVFLKNFIDDESLRIFSLYGVPMIGKSFLIQRFIEDQSLKGRIVINTKLNPQPDDPEAKIKKDLFPNATFNDLSTFAKGTVIIIQNFEEVLKWSGDFTKLHDIQDKYKELKSLLRNITTSPLVKLIIESRFQINFDDLGFDANSYVALQLKGIDKDLFWQYYKQKNFTKNDFDRLCMNFNNHTGLLALAYNKSEWLYDGNLLEALDKPKATTRYLWEYLDNLIHRLEDQEIWVLCALTYSKDPISDIELCTSLETISAFNGQEDIERFFFSLRKKLLIQPNEGKYELNPYVKEVCYTFLSVHRKKEINTIAELPYFKTKGQRPVYDNVRQAVEQENYYYLFNLGKDLISKKEYDKAIEVLNACLIIDPIPKYVLNEIGIAYERRGELETAIEYFEKAIKYNNIHSKNELARCYMKLGKIDTAVNMFEELIKVGHLPAYNELAMYHRKNGKYDDAIPLLNHILLKKPQDNKAYNELAICYQKKGDFSKAIEFAWQSIENEGYAAYTTLVHVYEHIKQYKRAYELALEGLSKDGWDKTILQNLLPLLKKRSEMKKVFISYSQDSQKHKNKVRELAERLIKDGVDTIIDQYINGNPPSGWRRWMEEQIEVVDYVLCVFTNTYKRRWEGKEEPGKGLGATREAIVIDQILYEEGHFRKKVIPIIFDPADKEQVPYILRDLTIYYYPNDFDVLYFYITEQPEFEKPDLGEIRKRDRV